MGNLIAYKPEEISTYKCNYSLKRKSLSLAILESRAFYVSNIFF